MDRKVKTMIGRGTFLKRFAALLMAPKALTELRPEMEVADPVPEPREYRRKKDGPDIVFMPVSGGALTVLATDPSGLCRIRSRWGAEGCTPGPWADSGLLLDPVVVEIDRDREREKTWWVECYAENAEGVQSDHLEYYFES